MARKQWTSREDAFMRRHYRCCPCRQIAMTLHRSLKSVYGRADVLGLLKPQAKPYRGLRVKIVREETDDPSLDVPGPDDPSMKEIIQRAQEIRQERAQRIRICR